MKKPAIIFLAPAMIVLAVFLLYPILDTFRMSTYNWNGISSAPEFIGLENWAALLGDGRFWAAFCHNIKVMVLSVFIQIPLGLFMATFIQFLGKKALVFKILWFLPMLMSSVAIGFLFTYLLATNGGVISWISRLLGGGNIDLLGNPQTALYTMAGVIAWQFTPFYMIYCVGAYANITEEVYAAALIDGADKSQYFFKIALPMLSPYLKNAAILSMAGSLKYFDLVYVMTGGGPGNSTELMATYMYKLSFSQFNMGYGSAVAGGMFILISAASILAVAAMTRKKEAA